MGEYKAYKGRKWSRTDVAIS